MDIYKISKSLEALGLKERDKVLIALSGGVDSLSLAYALKHSKLNLICYAAHMNFSLRGEESNNDQLFVENWCSINNITLFTKKVDTYKYAKDNSISIEMAARDLRYSWFNELLKEQDIKFLAVGHNADDNAETLFLNLVRGTGIKGICGISKTNGSIIRPLLDYTRKEIEKFAIYYNLKYRVDSTNADSDFNRNKIRNLVFPQLTTINPSLIKTLNRNIKYFNIANSILDNLFECIKPLFVEESDSIYLLSKININKLKDIDNWEYWIFIILNEYGFNSTQVDDISKYLTQEYTGVKRIETNEFICIYERGYIKIYSTKILKKVEPLIINNINKGESLQVCFGEFVINLSIEDNNEELFANIKNNNSNLLYIDFKKIEFPIHIRQVEDGDRFSPLGMNGAKKVNDFFADIKLDNIQKNKIPIITNPANQVICLAGLRIDNKYKVKRDSILLLKIETSLTN